MPAAFQGILKEQVFLSLLQKMRSATNLSSTGPVREPSQITFAFFGI
jgi:hypothetical protein